MNGYPDSFSEAKAEGSLYYDTGKPCKYGHYAVRFTSTRMCFECHRETCEKWREENPERNREIAKNWRERNPDYQEQWYEENKEQKKQQNKEWRDANREYFNKKTREWKEENREYHNQQSRQRYWDNHEYEKELGREWQRNNKEHAKEQIKKWREENYGHVKALSAKQRSLKRQAIPLWFEEEEVKQFYENCPEDHEVDHIVPIQAKNKRGQHVACGLHCFDNLQYLPKEENQSKGNRPPELANNFLD